MNEGFTLTPGQAPDSLYALTKSAFADSTLHPHKTSIHGQCRSFACDTRLPDMTHFTPWSVECVKRVSNPSGLLSILFPIVAGAGGIFAYLTNQLAAHSEAKHGPRILNPRQERTFIRIASAAKGESVHIKTFGDNPKAEQFLRQVERLIFDSGIMISRSVMLEPQTPIANQYTITIVTIELPNLSSPPDVATVLCRAFNVIGIHTPIVAKSDRDYDKDVAVRIYVTM